MVLFGHQVPLFGKHSRLEGCTESLDHYIVQIQSSDDDARRNWRALVGVHDLSG